MADLRDDELTYIKSDDNTRLTVLKGGVYICEIKNSGEFKEVLAGYFNKNVGLSGNTLITLGEFVNKLEEQRKIHESEKGNTDGISQ